MSLSWVAGAAGAAAQWAKENPRTTAAVASGSLVCVAPGLLVAPVLGILGFTGNGVAAGMIHPLFVSEEEDLLADHVESFSIHCLGNSSWNR